MLGISVTFEGFQLVFNFMLFFTLTLFFSIHEKYQVAEIWGGGGGGGLAAAPILLPGPRFLGACIVYIRADYYGFKIALD